MVVLKQMVVCLVALLVLGLVVSEKVTAGKAVLWSFGEAEKSSQYDTSSVAAAAFDEYFHANSGGEEWLLVLLTDEKENVLENPAIVKSIRAGKSLVATSVLAASGEKSASDAMLGLDGNAQSVPLAELSKKLKEYTGGKRVISVQFAGESAEAVDAHMNAAKHVLQQQSGSKNVVFAGVSEGSALAASSKEGLFKGIFSTNRRHLSSSSGSSRDNAESILYMPAGSEFSMYHGNTYLYVMWIVYLCYVVSYSISCGALGSHYLLPSYFIITIS